MFSSKLQVPAIALWIMATIASPFATASLAETRYVSDRLIITVRQSPDDGAETLGTLKTDAPVEVLEERGRFLRVRTEDGVEGWVADQYITAEIPKTKAIEELMEETERLRESVRVHEEEGQRSDADFSSAKRQYDKSIADLKLRLDAREKELGTVKDELVKVSERYENLKQQSKDVVGLAEERDRLRKEHEALGIEARGLRAENEHLRREGVIRWFLAGGGVFFMGWLAGKVSRRKKSYY